MGREDLSQEVGRFNLVEHIQSLAIVLRPKCFNLRVDIVFLHQSKVLLLDLGLLIKLRRLRLHCVLLTLTKVLVVSLAAFVNLLDRALDAEDLGTSWTLAA